MAVDTARARSLGSLLSKIPLKVVHGIEERDPQYLAVARIARACGRRVVALVVGNALISYRLTLRGEDYWLELASYLEENCSSTASIESILVGFLEVSRGNRFLREQKKKRLVKASRLLEDIALEPEKYSSLPVLVAKLAKTLRARGDEKTLFFAAKMAYYAYRVMGINAQGAGEIGIPIDRRIAFLTASSKLVEVDCIDAILSKYRREALRAWSIVSEESGIPLLNLDSLLWLPLRGPDSLLARGLVGEAREKYAENLYRYSRGEIPLDFARKIARALLQLKPRARC